MCSVPGCGKKHTKFLHQINVTNHNVNLSENVFMPVVPVVINDVYQTYALLDSASTTSFCVQNVVDKLGVKSKKVTYNLCTLSKDNETKTTETVDIDIRAKNGHDQLHMTGVYTTDKIPVTMPLCSGTFKHLQGLPLHHGDIEVEVLSGQDNSEALIPLEVRRGNKGEPFAMRTMLGWTLNGPTGDVANRKAISYFLSALTTMKDDSSRPAWVEEVEDEVLGPSINDEKVLKLWRGKNELVDGHYQLPIPWREGAEFQNNLEAVIPRLHSLKRSLERKNIYEQYDNEVQKILTKGYAEPVPRDEYISENKTWYLPHQPVVSDKKPGKLRVVFDCAARYRGESLNDKALQGPDLNNRLSHVILRFREHPYAFMADVEAMYNQVHVPEEDRDALRFLWYDKDGTVQYYRMTRHLFGGVWCASAATYALRCSADGEVDPRVQDTIHHAFYVDDCLKSVGTRDDAEAILHGTRETLAGRGFHLTKFVTNDQEVLSNLPTEEVAKEIRFNDETNHSKALGIKWDVEADEFYFSILRCDDTQTTKRTMLSYLSSLYDPLGLVGPVTLKGKMIYQEAVRQRLGWDDAIPVALSKDWTAWAATITDVQKIRVPRCIKPVDHAESVLELHHFSDASEKAYGCCSYLRCINKDGRIHTALVMSKSRVAPIKSFTIPRLELQAAVLAAQVDAMLRRELHLPLMTSQFWVDSEIVLKYIKNDDKRFHVFVSNRVSCIRRLTKPEQWRHVSGEDNPADIISRGSTARDINVDKWLKGPDFLKDYKVNWRDEEILLELGDDDPEVKRQVSHRIAVTGAAPLEPLHAEPNENTVDTPVKHIIPRWHPMDKLIAHYSSWHKLKRAVAWLLKIKQRIKDKVLDGDKRLTTHDLRHSEQAIIRHSQSDLRKLVSSGCKEAEVRRLNPYVDEEGIVRVGGRVPGMETTSKNQAIISDSNIAQLIIRHFHRIGHLGTEYTLAQVRGKFWIQRKEVKMTLRGCITCKKINGRSCTQKMADLPDTRTAEGMAPFTHTGVDCFGPFSVKRARSTVKRYGLVCTCMTTRAVHIEVLDNMDTDSFLNALRRFISRRGQLKSINSDNRELRKWQ